MLRIILLLITIASANAASVSLKTLTDTELAAYLAEGTAGMLHHSAPELCTADLTASPELSEARHAYKKELADLQSAFSRNPSHLLNTLSLFGWEKTFDRYFRGRIQRFVQAIQTEDVTTLRTLLTETPEWAHEPLWVSNAAGHAVMYVYPLILAVGVGSLRVVSLLLKFEASPHHQAAHLTGDTDTDVAYGHSALTLAAHYHDYGILELFGVPMPTPPTLTPTSEEEVKGEQRSTDLPAAPAASGRLTTGHATTALAHAVLSGTAPSTSSPVPAPVAAVSKQPTSSIDADKAHPASPLALSRDVKTLGRKLPPAGGPEIHGKPPMELVYDLRTFTFEYRPVTSSGGRGCAAGGAGSSGRAGSPLKAPAH